MLATDALSKPTAPNAITIRLTFAFMFFPSLRLAGVCWAASKSLVALAPCDSQKQGRSRAVNSLNRDDRPPKEPTLGSIASRGPAPRTAPPPAALALAFRYRQFGEEIPKKAVLTNLTNVPVFPESMQPIGNTDLRTYRSRDSAGGWSARYRRATTLGQRAPSSLSVRCRFRPRGEMGAWFSSVTPCCDGSAFEIHSPGTHRFARLQAVDYDRAVCSPTAAPMEVSSIRCGQGVMKSAST